MWVFNADLDQLWVQSEELESGPGSMFVNVGLVGYPADDETDGVDVHVQGRRLAQLLNAVAPNGILPVHPETALGREDPGDLRYAALMAYGALQMIAHSQHFPGGKIVRDTLGDALGLPRPGAGS